MTFNIGDKVRVNDTYAETALKIDQRILDTRGSEGVVTGYLHSFIKVKATKTTYESWKDFEFLFYLEELDLLEEADPLQKESIKSTETASEINSDGAPFKVGDLVKVVNYHHVWDGTVGRVHEIYSPTFVNIRTATHKEFGLGFSVSSLELVGEAL